MHYTRALEALEGFSNALSTYCTKQVVAWTILYTLVKVGESQKLLMVVNKASSSLLVDSNVCHIDGIHE